MLEIFKVVRQVYYDHLTNTADKKWSDEFRAGYRHCVDLLLIGMQRHPTYNLHLQNQQLQNQICSLEVELAEARLIAGTAAETRRIVRTLSETNHAINVELAEQKELIHEVSRLLVEHKSNELIGPVARLVARYLTLKEYSKGFQSRKLNQAA